MAKRKSNKKSIKLSATAIIVILAVVIIAIGATFAWGWFARGMTPMQTISYILNFKPDTDNSGNGSGGGNGGGGNTSFVRI